MRAELSFVLLMALCFAVIAFGLLRPAPRGVDENETCWACGLRGQHKLWCPNR